MSCTYQNIQNYINFIMIQTSHNKVIWLCATSIIIITIAIIYQVSASNNISEIDDKLLMNFFGKSFENHLTQYINFQYTDTHFKIEVGRINKPSIYFEVFGKIPDDQGIGPITTIRGDGLFDKEIELVIARALLQQVAQQDDVHRRAHAYDAPGMIAPAGHIEVVQRGAIEGAFGIDHDGRLGGRRAVGEVQGVATDFE